jgi:hypothetical protein
MKGTSIEGKTTYMQAIEKNWLRGLDSNQDNQLQRLACYQLHYPGIAENQDRVT